MRTSALWILVTLAGCGAPVGAPSEDASAPHDAAPDAPASADAAPLVDVAWSECPPAAGTAQYAVQTCADATRASATLSSAHPSWLCDNGSEVVSVETCIARSARAQERPGVDTSFVTRCALDRLPAPCTCNCARDRWRTVAPQCPETRRYLAAQLSYLVATAVRVGSCW